MKIPSFAILTVTVLWIFGFNAAGWFIPSIANLLGVKFIALTSSDTFTPNFSLAFLFSLCGIGATVISLINSRNQEDWSVRVFTISTATLIFVAIYSVAIKMLQIKYMLREIQGTFNFDFRYSNLSFFSWGSWSVILVTIIISVILFFYEPKRNNPINLPQENPANTPKQ